MITFPTVCVCCCNLQSELPFLNSMKMKMSILLGVVHMNLGIVMSLFNNLYFKDRLSTICEFVPQVRCQDEARSSVQGYMHAAASVLGSLCSCVGLVNVAVLQAEQAPLMLPPTWSVMGRVWVELVNNACPVCDYMLAWCACLCCR